MKCEEFLFVIEAYFDGETDEKNSQLIAVHLSDCGACAVEYDRLCREQELYKIYERDISVTPALWAGVQARIREEKAVQQTGRIRQWLADFFSAPRLSLVATAALVVIAVGATIAVMSYLNSRNPTSNPPPVDQTARNDQQSNSGKKDEPDSRKPDETAPKDDTQSGPDNGGNQMMAVASRPARPAVKAKPTPEQLVREAEQKYVAAIALLSKEVNRRRTDIDPAVLARFDGALAAIDRTIEDTRRAVRQSPNDPIALQYMLAAYARKVDVLREMADD